MLEGMMIILKLKNFLEKILKNGTYKGGNLFQENVFEIPHNETQPKNSET